MHCALYFLLCVLATQASILQHIKTSLFGYSLDGLRNTLTASDAADPEPLMEYVKYIDWFPKSIQHEAIKLIQSAFWSKKANKYKFSSRFQTLSADHLSLLIKIVGDSNIEKHIFEDENKQILSHYSQSDLIELLNNHYSNAFATFVFQKFDNYLETPLSERETYLQTVSIDIMIMVYEHHNISQYLCSEELIIFFKKMQNYLAVNNTQDEMNNCSVIFSSVTKQIIQQNIELLTNEDLYFIAIHNSVTEIELKKYVIDESKKRFDAIQNDLNHKDNLIAQYINEIGSVTEKIPINISNHTTYDNGISYELKSIKKQLNSRTQYLNSVIKESAELRNEMNYLYKLLQTEYDRSENEENGNKTGKVSEKPSLYFVVTICVILTVGIFVILTVVFKTFKVAMVAQSPAINEQKYDTRNKNEIIQLLNKYELKHLWSELRERGWTDTSLWLHIDENKLRKMNIRESDIVRFKMLQKYLIQQNQTLFDAYLPTITKLYQNHTKVINGGVTTVLTLFCGWVYNKFVT